MVELMQLKNQISKFQTYNSMEKASFLTEEGIDYCPVEEDLFDELCIKHFKSGAEMGLVSIKMALMTLL